MVEPSKDVRFAEFLKRLADAPPAHTGREALALLAETLNEVEDELTEIPYKAEAWQTDGRMYPPREDAARDVPGRHDLVRYRSRAHSTYIRANGAIEIRDGQGDVVFQKSGADGDGVQLQD